MRIDRLKKCLASLPTRETKRARFDLNCYVVVKDCGTTACALGWYKLKHPRSGFTLINAHRHFEIAYNDQLELFYPNNDPRHDSLAGTRARLKAFIADHKKAVRK
jgi:hypothetical protein